MTPSAQPSPVARLDSAASRAVRDESAERRRRSVAVAFALVLHLLLAAGAYRAARPHRPAAPAAPFLAETVMHLRLIDTAPDAAVPMTALASAATVAPVPDAAPLASAPAAAADAPRVPSAAAVATPPDDRSVGAPVPQWLDRDGGVHLPAPAETPRSFPDRPLRDPAAPDPLAHRDPLPYAPTRFEKAWVPRDETLGGEWLRHATAERTVDLPQGYQLRCVWMLILGGCGWGKAPQATIEELQAMRADPPPPRAGAGRVGTVAAAPLAPAADRAAQPPAQPLDLSLPPPLEVPAGPPGGR